MFKLEMGFSNLITHIGVDDMVKREPSETSSLSPFNSWHALLRTPLLQPPLRKWNKYTLMCCYQIVTYSFLMYPILEILTIVNRQSTIGAICYNNYTHRLIIMLYVSLGSKLWWTKSVCFEVQKQSRNIVLL